MAEPNNIALKAQLDLLRSLYEEGQLSEQAYRAKLDGLGVDPQTVLDRGEQPPGKQSDATGASSGLPDYKRQAWQDRRDKLLEEYRAATAQLSRTLDDVERLRIKRQIADLEQQIQEVQVEVNHTALDCYLRHVVEANRCLQLQGIRSASGLVSIDLEEIYITLTATQRRTVTDEEAWVKEMACIAPGEAHRLPSRILSGVEGARGEKLGGEGRPRETVQQVKVKVQEAMADHTRLVVLGDPGCGKTTLLRYLALTFARGLGGEADLVMERLQLQEQRLPILLPLRDFARYLEKNHPDAGADGPKLLLDYLHLYFANQDIALPERFFADRLQNGECVVLLDGVDEVADLSTRYRAARIIERFTIAYPNNRYVITSRIVGYTGSARLGENYAVTTVRDFTWNDIERFVTGWNRAVEIVLAGGDTPYAQTQTRRYTEALLAAIRDNERVRELAVNPLMLTVIALVQRYRAQLPERRTELYEEAVEVLLGSWDLAKGLPGKSVISGLELDSRDRRGLLEPVALWMMENHAREIETDELRRQLGQRFYEMVGNWRQAGKAVDEFVQLINERSGLLAERGQGVYAFSHLTFQEHLAARAVSDKPDYVEYTLARLGDSWWREVVLLEAGYLSTQGKRRVTALVQAVMDCNEEPEPYHNLVLAAECMRDAGPAQIQGDLRGEVQRRLRKEFEQPLRKPQKGDKIQLADVIRRRASAAEALAKIESGGPGTQPAFWRMPYGEPVWVEVPAGEFWMGSDQVPQVGDADVQQVLDAQKPAHRVYVDRFQIARTPITNTQYQLFVEAVGHRPPKGWESNRPPKGKESHPVVNVSWHDAMAYCKWLAQVTGKPIALPSEAQWEKAASWEQGEGETGRGGDKETLDSGQGDREQATRNKKRIYPWGDEWDETKCNNDELGIEGTTPVGIFPEGASPYGCLDMAGNVWEWTTSLWGPREGDKAVLQFKYPYNANDGRENLEAGDDVLRVLRGGSFDNTADSCRCAVRYGGYPQDDWNNFGFRVVVSPISPLSSAARPSEARERGTLVSDTLARG